MIEKIKTIYRYFKPVIIFVMSILFQHIIPISHFVTFIDKNYYNSIDISLYTAILSILFAIIEDELKKRQTEINIIYYNKRKKELFSDPCTLSINEDGYERLLIQIMINGNINYKNGTILKIKFPNYVLVDNEKKIFFGELKNNCLCINLKDIAKQNAGQNFTTIIELQVNQSETFNGSSIVASTLQNKDIMTSLNNRNKLKFKISKED